jgi:hypothetical protein
LQTTAPSPIHIKDVLLARTNEAHFPRKQQPLEMRN